MDNDRKPRVFVSYSRKDRKYCDQFIEHIGMLQNLCHVVIFDDSQILPGERWEDRIRTELCTSDIVVFLVSSSFSSSHYCVVKEMVPAIERDAKIFWVLVRPVDYESLPLAAYHGLPKDAQGSLKPVSTWRGEPGRDEAWAQVAKALRVAAQALQPQPTLAVAAEEDFNPWEHLQWNPSESGPFCIEETMKYEVNHVWFYVGLPRKISHDSSIMSAIDLALSPIKQYISDTFLPPQEDSVHLNRFFISAPFRILIKNRKLVSVESYVRSVLGGAHSSYEYVTVNRDLSQSREIELSDLFISIENSLVITKDEMNLSQGDSFSQFWPHVAKEILRQKNARAGTLSMDDIASVERIPSFQDLRFSFIASVGNQEKIGGLRFVFSPYEIGSFAEGPYEINIDMSIIFSFASDYFRYLVGDVDDAVLGRYARKTANTQAEITILPTVESRAYQVRGFAAWGIDREYGPNIGEIDVIAMKKSGVLYYRNTSENGSHYTLEIQFTEDGISLREDGYSGMYGMNVTFNGKYIRIGRY
jgi:hypothetical protein